MIVHVNFYNPDKFEGAGSFNLVLGIKSETVKEELLKYECPLRLSEYIATVDEEDLIIFRPPSLKMFKEEQGGEVEERTLDLIQRRAEYSADLAIRESILTRDYDTFLNLTSHYDQYGRA